MKRYVELTLGDETYRLVPGAAALLRVAEEVADPGKLCLAALPVGGMPTPPNAAHVLKTLYLALIESGYDLKRDAAYEALHAAGLFNLYDPYNAFIAGLVNGGEVPDADEDQESEKKTTGSNRRKSPGAAT